jgi:hypothetical protein
LVRVVLAALHRLQMTQTETQEILVEIQLLEVLLLLGLVLAVLAALLVMLQEVLVAAVLVNIRLAQYLIQRWVQPALLLQAQMDRVVAIVPVGVEAVVGLQEVAQH